jgi:Holliday junction resolvase
MTPEAKVKAQVKKILDKLGVYYFFPAANGMGRAGIPDVIGCMGGQFVAIECKAGKGKTTALQDRELDRIVDARGLAWVINELNIDKLEGCLNAYRK